MSQDRTEVKPEVDKIESEQDESTSASCNAEPALYLEAMSWKEKIRRLIERAGWTASEAGRRSGVPYSTLKNYLNVKHAGRPSLEHGLSLARTLGVDPFWLYDDSAKWPPVPLTPQQPPQPMAPIDLSSPDVQRVLHALAAALQQQAGTPGSESRGDGRGETPGHRR